MNFLTDESQTGDSEQGGEDAAVKTDSETDGKPKKSKPRNKKGKTTRPRKKKD